MTRRHTARSSRDVPIFRPNDPPMSPQSTRTLSGAMPSCPQSVIFARCTPWFDAVHRQHPGVGIEAGDAAAALHRHVLMAVLVDAWRETTPVGLREHRVEIAVARGAPVHEDVAARVLEDRRAGRVEGVGGRRDRPQIVVVDLDQLGTVLRQVLRLGDTRAIGSPTRRTLSVARMRERRCRQPGEQRERRCTGGEERLDLGARVDRDDARAARALR